MDNSVNNQGMVRFRSSEEANNWGHIFERALEAEFRAATAGGTTKAASFAASAADMALLQVRQRSGQPLLDPVPSAPADDAPMPTDADAPGVTREAVFEE